MLDVHNYVSSAAACEIIPNFVPPTPPVDSLPSWWREDFNHRNVFLFFGRIHEKKGWRSLVNAWAQACDRSERFRSRSELVFAGWVDDSPDFESVVAQVRRKYSNVQFIGPQYGPDRLSTMRKASVLVLPSYSEGLPMTVLEGWSLGVPAILTAECNLPEGIEYGAAIEVRPSRNEIADGLLHFDELDTKARDAMRVGALNAAQQSFSERAVVDALVRLYRRIAVN